MACTFSMSPCCVITLLRFIIIAFEHGIMFYQIPACALHEYPILTLDFVHGWRGRRPRLRRPRARINSFLSVSIHFQLHDSIFLTSDIFRLFSVRHLAASAFAHRLHTDYNYRHIKSGSALFLMKVVYYRMHPHGLSANASLVTSPRHSLMPSVYIFPHVKFA